MDQISFSSTQFQAVTTPSLNMVADGQGLQLWVLGIMMTMKALANETGGTYSAFEDMVPPNVGPPAHIHTLEEESMYMLDGEVLLKVGDKEFIAKKGTFVHLPRFVPHSFFNKGDKPARIFITYAPGGFERMFLDIGTPVLDPTKTPPMPTDDELDTSFRLGKEYGIIWVPPSEQ